MTTSDRTTKTKKHGDEAPEGGRRQQASEQRRAAILAAALEVFAAEGFAAARLDDIAAKAGVAKGTIYLSFKDKEHLFEQVLISAVAPVLAKVETLADADDASFDQVLETLFDFFRREVLETPRQEVIRLVLIEGPRFPQIAEVYHREVVSKGLDLIRRIARNAAARGELSHDAVARFPHLVFAPMLMAVLWNSVFARLAPLDVEGLLEAHRTLLANSGSQRKRRKA